MITPGSQPRAKCWTVLLLALCACTEDKKQPTRSTANVEYEDGLGEPQSASENADPTADESQDSTLRKRLQGLGYADYAVASDPNEPEGVFLREDESWSGYDLVTAISLNSAVLFDPEGVPVHSWREEGSNRWSRARLLPDGDLLVVGGGANAKGKHEAFLHRLSWSGETRWKAAIGAHHDFEVLDDGRILTLTKGNVVEPRFADGKVKDNSLAYLSATGEVEREIPLLKLLLDARIVNVDAATVEPWSVTTPDPVHANTVFVMKDPALIDEHPLYALGNVLVTCRHQHLIVVVDPTTETVIWSFGPGQLELPHDTKVLANGNLLLFDNGSPERGYSRVVELDPRTKEIVWQYRADPPESFYSPSRGTVQPLPGGTVLVGNSDRAEAFEVTRDGRVVWRFRNPLRGEEGRSVLRLERYSAEYVDAARASQ